MPIIIFWGEFKMSQKDQKVNIHIIKFYLEDSFKQFYFFFLKTSLVPEPKSGLDSETEYSSIFLFFIY